METQLLREQEIFPSKEVLKEALGKVYNVLEELETRLAQDEFALTFAWHYYRDSKAWLCKVSHKKKTVFWLSVWDGFFKISFFFLERHMKGISALKINENNFTIEKEWGKMIPLIFNINSKKQFSDLLKMVELKKKSK
jgi:hypothetical protein